MTDEVKYGLDGEIIQSVESGTVVVANEECEDVAFPHADRENITQLQTSLEWLCNLHYTVSREGISENDVDALMTLRRNVLGGESTKVALESYVPKMFTPERTGLNLHVATEGIGTTVIDTIKAIIRKLVEYLNRAAQWLKRQVRDERFFKVEIDRRVNAIKRLKEGSDAIEKRIGSHPVSVDKPLADFTYKLLTDNTFPLNGFVFALMNDVSYRNELNTLITRVQGGLAPEVASVVGEIARLLDVGRNVKPVGVISTNSLQQAIKEIEALQQVMPDVKEAITTLGFEPFNFALTPLINQVTPYGYLVDLYEDAETTLKRVQKFGESVDVNKINSYTANLTYTVDCVTKIANYLIDFNRLKIKLLTARYKYEAMRFNLLCEHMTSTAVDEVTHSWMEKLRDEVESYVKGLVK